MAQTPQSNRTSQSAIDQRAYIRLKSIFPVEFAIIHTPEDLLDIYWQQGYTCNVGKGGICLEMIASDEETLRRLEGGKATLELRIGIPLGAVPLKARAKVTWYEKAGEDAPGKYLVGLKFTSIAALDLSRMVTHARRIKYSSYAAAIVSAIFFIILVVAGGYNYKLRLANEELVDQLVATQQEEIKIHAAIEEIIQEGNIVLEQIKENTTDEAELQELEGVYKEIIERKDRISDHLSVLERKKGGLQATVLEKMHLWLKNHQNASTGLIVSFEGNDKTVKDWAFIYDQALAVQVFLSFGNDKGARKILNFFHARIKGDFQGFYNGYYYDSGEIAESTVHSGPNIWIGIAALQYIYKTGDKYYLPMARKITDWLITVQDKDPVGGIKGGPEVPWFSTEHNLDAYALFYMMYQTTEEQKYRMAKEKVLSWLNDYAMVSHAEEYKVPPVNRGKGDATIATDTYAWSLAAIGPKKLKEMGMDPEAIMKFAEEHCAVIVQYTRPSGIELTVSGFDFSKPAHVARGGLVSPELTSQMIIAFRILSDYFVQKGDFYKGTYYEEKAKAYLNELNKLIISSPSAKGQGEGCLPYSTLENADTGHGWHTPYGTRTCSVAGTGYMIMAIKHWNPLSLGRRR